MARIYYTESGTAYVVRDGRITRRGSTPVVSARTGAENDTATGMTGMSFRFLTPPVEGERLRLRLHDGDGTLLTTSPVVAIGRMPW